MPFVPAVDTVRLAIEFTDVLNNPAANVLHFRKLGGAVVAADLDLLFDYVETWLQGEWEPMATDQWTATRLTARVMTTQFGLVAARSIAKQGNVAVEREPANVTVAVAFKSGLAGRTRNGRIYHVGTTPAQIVGDTVTSAFATQLLNLYNELIANAVGETGMELVIASYQENGVPRTTALLTPVTNAALTDLTTDSMRRRLPGRGR